MSLLLLFGQGASAPVRRPRPALFVAGLAALGARPTPAVSIGRVPARTVRLSPVQTTLLGRAPLRVEPRRGQVWIGSPHRRTDARPAKAALLLRPLPPPYRGALFSSRVPGRTVRLTPLQTTALLVRRDERRQGGAYFQSRVPARTVRLSPAQERALIVRRDERRSPGAVVFTGPRRSTPNLTAGLLKILVARRDERRAAGAIWIGRVPGRTARLLPGQERALIVSREARASRGATFIGSPRRAPVVLASLPLKLLTVRRDEKRGAGVVLFTGPRRDTRARPVPGVLVARRPERRPGGFVLASRVPGRTVRLSSPQLTALVAHRPERGFNGAVFIGTIRRPAVVSSANRPAAIFTARSPARRPGGAIMVSRVPDRTQRLAPVQTTALIVRQPGPERPRGQVWIAPPLHSTAARPRPLLAVALSRAARPAGLVSIGRVPARSGRLAALQGATVLTRRAERPAAGSVLFCRPPRATPAARPAALLAARTVSGTAVPQRGAVWMVRLRRLPAVPRVPVLVTARRDQRFTPGWLFVGRSAKMDATTVAHGNPRARVTQRAAPVAAVTLRLVG